MGVVHRATDEDTGQDVALKVVFLGPGTEEIRARFDRECLAMNMIQYSLKTSWFPASGVSAAARTASMTRSMRCVARTGP